MKILGWVRKENSGLLRTTLELAKYTERLGHTVSLRTPKENKTFYGPDDDDFDVHCIHSQINPRYWKDGKPKFLFLHGNPFYGLETMISTNAILDLVPICDAFISFYEIEAKIWNSFKKTFLITKGVDLEKYKKIDIKKKFKGDPVVLFVEHWRSFKHPMVVLVAMEKVKKVLPDAVLYLFGCDKEKQEFWKRIIIQNKYNWFCPGVFKWQKNIVNLYNAVDMIVSPTFLSYSRTTPEALACDKPVLGGMSNVHANYQFQPNDPDELAEKIIKCHMEKPKGMREYAEKNCSSETMAKEAVEIYKRYL